jgi:hypothetical protein
MQYWLRSILAVLALQSQLFGLLGGGLVLCVAEDGHAVVEAMWLGQSPCCDTGNATGITSSTDVPGMDQAGCGPCDDTPLGSAQMLAHRQGSRTCDQSELAAVVQHSLVPLLATPAANERTLPVSTCWYTPPLSHRTVLLI